MSASKKILLTGVTGFIGSDLYLRLLESYNPEDIHLLLRKNPDSQNSLLANRLKEYKQPWTLFEQSPKHYADFSDQDSLKVALDRLPDLKDCVVIHLAAMIDASKAQKDEQKKINQGATGALLDWANHNASLFLYSSSVAAFGGSTSEAVRSEKDYPIFESQNKTISYMESKRAAHEYVLNHSKIPAYLLCPGIVHGSLEYFKSSRSHISKVLKKLNYLPYGGVSLSSLDFFNKAVLKLLSSDYSVNAKSQVYLTIQENLLLADYFSLMAKVCGLQKSFRSYPRFFSRTVMHLHKFCVGLNVLLFEKLLTASQFYYFESEKKWDFEFKSIEDSLKDALLDPAFQENFS